MERLKSKRKPWVKALSLSLSLSLSLVCLANARERLSLVYHKGHGLKFINKGKIRRWSVR